MAEDKKIRVSTLDEWHSALAGMYNALKNENADRYITDVGKDYESSSKLTSGAKVKVEHINNLISNINNLNGKDSNGNIPTNKDDLKVYFWYSDWSQPPGEIAIGDTKIKIQSQLRKSINDTVSELKQICVNNSKDKVPFCQFDPETYYNKNTCNDYYCTDQNCITYGTITNTTIPDSTVRHEFGTSSNSTQTRDSVNTPVDRNTTIHHSTIEKKNSKDGKTVKDSQKFAKKVKPDYGQTHFNYNCNQYGQTATCPFHITNNKYYTEGKRKGDNIRRTGDIFHTKNSPVTPKNTKDGVTTYKQKPKDSREGHVITNGTVSQDVTTVYSTAPSFDVFPNSTIIDHSQHLGNIVNVRRIQECNYCAPDCSQDIRCQTYNIGYKVKVKKDGTGYEEFKCSDTVNIGKYLYIPPPKEK